MVVLCVTEPQKVDINKNRVIGVRIRSCLSLCNRPYHSTSLWDDIHDCDESVYNWLLYHAIPIYKNRIIGVQIRSCYLCTYHNTYTLWDDIHDCDKSECQKQV